MWQEKHRVGGPSRQIDSFADTEIDILIEDEDYFVFIKAKVVAPGRTARFGTWKRQGASLVAVADPELHEALRQIGILYAVRERPRGGAPPLGFGSGETFLGPQVLLAVELDRLLDGDEVDLAPDQGLHDLDHLREAATEPRQLADQQTVAGLQRPQHFVDAALERTLARRDPGLDELVDREAAFLAELEDRQLLVGEVLRTSGDAEVSDGFQGGVQEKVEMGLFATVNDYSIQNIV